MLRSRSRPDNSLFNFEPAPVFLTSSRAKARRRSPVRIVLARWVTWMILAIILTASFLYSCPWKSNLKTSPPLHLKAYTPLATKNSASSKPELSTRHDKIHAIKPLRAAVSQEQESFVVERTILMKLEKLQQSLEPSEPHAPSPPNAVSHWPPLVTRIPELKRIKRPNRASSAASHSPICDPSRPCRFLVPVRISEQESNSRNHLLQLVHLASALNRTLVLPRVGKNRIGVCFSWDFEAYYDLRSLQDSSGVRLARIVDLKSWAKVRSHTTQIVSVRARGNRSTGFQDDFTSFDNGGTLSVTSFYDMQDMNLPGCFDTRFSFLELGDFPHLQISVDPHLDRFSGPSLVTALSEKHVFDDVTPLDDSEDQSSQAIPDVLVVSWELSFPVFSPSSVQPLLRYSDHLYAIAENLAPSTPYLAIHWRMETTPREILLQCAHTLVDSLARLLYDPLLSDGITTVWFASDYPHSIVNVKVPLSHPRFSGLFSAGENKPDTLGYDEGQAAMEILSGAFADGGDLAHWKLTQLTNKLGEMNTGNDKELLRDTGVLGILDKIVASRATLFLGGERACGPPSSFTRQIIEMRRIELSVDGTNLRNLVEIFG